MKALYPTFVWAMPAAGKSIYLTFDDGPIPEITDFVLDTLNEFEAKASFFVIGKNIVENRHIFNKILLNGHSVGNHTMTHLNGWKTDNQAYISDFEQCKLQLPAGNLFRPPYGRLSRFQADQVQKSHKVIMWSVLSGDFSADISKETCLKKCLQYTESGSIVLFHDSLKASKNMMYTLPRFLVHFKELGYDFKALPMHL